MNYPLKTTVLLGILFLQVSVYGGGSYIFSDFLSGCNSNSTFRYSSSSSERIQTVGFGRNNFGQLFTKPNSDSALVVPNWIIYPTGIDSLSNVKISTGKSHSLLLYTKTIEKQGVYSVGSNLYGELGRSINAGTNGVTHIPQKIQIPGNLVPPQIHCGSSFSILIGPGNFMFSFGNNLYGQLGNTTNVGTNNVNFTPLFVSTPDNVENWDTAQLKSAIGADHCLAIGIRTDGSKALYAWGSNLYGQLGILNNSGTSNPNPMPTFVPLPSPPVYVYAGKHYSLISCQDGNLYAFGRNKHGQLGVQTNAGTDTPNPSPLLVNHIPTGSWYNIAVGGEHVLAIGGSNLEARLYSWGSNKYGQLGTTQNVGTDLPNPDYMPVDGLPVGDVNGSPRQVEAGENHSLAGWNIDPSSGGYQKSWGLNLYGQLGNYTNWGTTNPNPFPLDVMTNYTVSSVIKNNNYFPEFILEQNYPNPFNPTTTIKYNLPAQGYVKILVYDILGREVATIVNRNESAGLHEEVFDASYLPSGIYIYVLNLKAETMPVKYYEEQRKMLLIK